MNLINQSIGGLVGFGVALGAAFDARAGIVWFDDDFTGWKSAAASYSTCDFTGFPLFTVITNQYSGLGALFTSPGPTYIDYAPGGFAQDSWGINPQGYLEVKFLSPMNAVGGHYPGVNRIQFFLGDVFLGQTPYLGGSGPYFGGVTSDLSFDRVRFISIVHGGIAFMDNLYFSAVPGPGPLAILLVGGMLGRRRRTA